MARFLHSIYYAPIRKWDKLILALSWAMGLILGCFVFRHAGSGLTVQIPMTVGSQPSIFGLLVTALLPLLFAGFAVYIGAPGLLWGICFCKAFLFMYVSCGVLEVYKSAGWLIRWMLMFTDLGCCVLMYCYCRRHISGIRGFSIGEFTACTAALSLIAGADHSVISPLLRRVLS